MPKQFTNLFIPITTSLLLFLGCTKPATDSEKVDQPIRPNIIWIIPDDMSANFSCYGETAIQTPHVDQLAAEGVRFTHAYVTVPVCSPARSAFITGMYQTSIGAHHHRSGRGELKIHLPEGVQPIPHYFKEAGYYTSLGTWPPDSKRGQRTDYNFEWDKSIYDGRDWSGRSEGQPFFAQIHTRGGKLRGTYPSDWEKISKNAAEKLGTLTPLEAVDLPPYYPEEPDIIRDWQAYLESVRLTDAMVGEVIARLEEEGIRENTLVLFMTDHGISHARGKQFLYDEGLHVPLVISGPGIIPGTVREDLVEHIDIAALSLGAADIPIPEKMQAKDILAENYEARTAVFAARDRCDETVDYIRSVRTKEFKYIRNFLPNRPYLQPNRYKDAKAILIALRNAHEAGRLNSIQELLMRNTRPSEELYDLRADPFEIHNLSGDSLYMEQLLKMRNQLYDWMESTGDKGAESEEMYDSDMAVYKSNLQQRDPQQLKILEKNIAIMKQWAVKGK